MLRVSLSQRNKARGILTWYARIFDTESKEIRYESLGTTKKTEARDLMADKLQAGEFEKKTESQRTTLSNAIDLYLKSLENRGVKGNSYDTARFAVSCLSSIGDVPISQLTKKTILEAFVSANEGVMASTYNMRRTYVKSAFKFFVNVLELIPSNIAEIIPAKKSNSRERDFWTIEQIDRILDAAPNQRFRLLWSFMAFAGLRIHEALKAKREDIRDGFIYVIGKGNKPAKVPVSSRLAKELERVNWEWDFTGMTRQSKTIRRVAAIAIPEGFVGEANNHRLRHSFASNLIRAGADVKSTQKLLRHANITTTLNIYSHLIDRDLNESIEKMFK